MTDHDRTLDELVSAYLDGEATADEQARVEGDPELQARLAVFASVRDAVGVVPPPPADEARDALLTRVMGAAIAPPKVVALRRRVEPARVVAVAAAIFAIAFLGGAVALLAEGNDGGSDDSASVAEDSDTALSTSGLASGSATTAAGSAAAIVDLGPFANEEALRVGLDAATKRLAGSSAGGGTAPDDNAEDSANESGGDSPAAAESATAAPSTFDAARAMCSADPTDVVYSAQLAGEPVLVVVRGGTATVVRQSDCEPLASFPQ